jgi:myosin heavy subunit
MPSYVNASYMLTQVRYLGVFETIQIRQKTFPARKTYADFISTFQPIFRKLKGRDDRDSISKILTEVKAKERDFLLGTKRIYMNKELEDKLNKEVYKFFRIKNEKAIKIQKSFKKFCMRRNLTKLAKRSKILKKIFARAIIKQLAKRYFAITEESRKKEDLKRAEKLKERQKVDE